MYASDGPSRAEATHCGMGWPSQSPGACILWKRSPTLVLDNLEKEATHQSQMLTQVPPFMDPSVHVSGAWVDQQIVDGWTDSHTFLPQFTPLSWDPMLGSMFPEVVIKAPTRILPRFAAMSFNTSGMISYLRTDHGQLRWAPGVESLALPPCKGSYPSGRGQAA